MIRAGSVAELSDGDARLLVIDMGFSSRGATCGWVLDDGEPARARFSELCEIVKKMAAESGEAMNVVIEAPLSVAFCVEGNPQARRPEYGDDGRATRCWYLNAGIGMLHAATVLLRRVVDNGVNREVRLFEGFVSFKPPGVPSSHVLDVRLLRDVVRGCDKYGRVIVPDDLRADNEHQLESAFKVAGMDFGVPPIVWVEPRPAEPEPDGLHG